MRQDGFRTPPVRRSTHREFHGSVRGPSGSLAKDGATDEGPTMPKSPPATRTRTERSRLPKVGEVIAGKYRLRGVLGSGGMGVVMAADHLALGTVVAVKFMHVGMLGNTVAVRRFAR